MDPDETLTELRACVTRLRGLGMQWELLDDVEALDAWLRAAGDLPPQWTAARPEPVPARPLWPVIDHIAPRAVLLRIRQALAALAASDIRLPQLQDPLTALDDWLSRGGMLPREWSATR